MHKEVVWTKLGDDELVTLAQSGNQTAFSELVRRYQPTCLKVAVSVLRDRSDAEDEVQNGILKAFEHIGQFNREARFSTWLTRIVVNQCLMRLRSGRRARLVYLDEIRIGEETGTLDLPAREQTPEQELGQGEVSAVVHREMNRIPPMLRNAFLLRDVQELPMAEVARRLGISVAAAKSRLLRARLELRERMAKHQGRIGLAALFAE